VAHGRPTIKETGRRGGESREGWLAAGNLESKV
jgi:hypothetical protein